MPLVKPKNHILLVEDQFDICKILSEYLTSLQCSLITCSTAEDALVVAKDYRNKFDLAILDIMLPGLNGLEFAQRIRVRPIYHNLPILFISGRYQDLKDLPDLAQTLSNICLLGKPFRASIFIQKVSELLGLYQSQE